MEKETEKTSWVDLERKGVGGKRRGLRQQGEGVGGEREGGLGQKKKGAEWVWEKSRKGKKRIGKAMIKAS